MRWALKAFTAASTRAVVGIRSRRYCFLPLSMRDQSSTDSIIPDSRAVSLERRSSTVCISTGSFTRPSASISMNMRMEVSGVRSSWLTRDTKSVFSRDSRASR